MFDDLFDAAHFDVVFFAEFEQIGDSCHFAVVAHDFDDDG